METKKWRKLSSEEENVILQKGTEPPFSGKYYHHFDTGIYLCRQCDFPLYRSYDKYNSLCGWPSFDDEIPGAVIRQPDQDGYRTEILCAHCHGHLGHIFTGEHQTPKNTRHCVNSLSLEFLSLDLLILEAEKGHIYGAAIFSAGCFWEVEYKFQQLPGVLLSQVGFIGGSTHNPSYQQVCHEQTGHAEAVRIIFQKQLIDYQQLVEFFFTMHDATQLNRQGVDKGPQYRSSLFYLDEEQKKISTSIMDQLKQQGQPIVTEIAPATHFWPAEDYHQQYVKKNFSSKFKGS